MPVREIKKLGEPVLRKKAKKIHRVDDYTRSLIQDLIDTLHEANGAGLAAPQIGVPLRAFVTSIDDELHVILNPEIVELSPEQEEGDEGCLSIPGWWGPVKRSTAVTVRGMGPTGKAIKVKSHNAYEARCFQHEIDHLDGVLFIDRMEDRSKLYQYTGEEVDEDEAAESAAV